MKRIIRVNELVKRELSEQLHTCYKGEAVHITITQVEVAPNLRDAQVYFSVLEGEVKKAQRFLEKIKSKLRRSLGKRVILKYLPSLHFVHDPSIERGTSVVQLLEDLEREEGG